MKKGLTVFLLTFLVVTLKITLLAKADLIETSMLPNDYSGFTLAICAEQIDTNAIEVDHISDDGRVCYIELTDSECKSLFNNATAISLGPQGAILWGIEVNNEKSFIVQHDHTLVLLLQALHRGAEDSANVLKNSLDYKSKIVPDIVNGDVRWSSNGRYLFLNETAKWFGFSQQIDDPYLADTFTGEIFIIETDGQEKKINTRGSYQCVEMGRFSQEDSAFYYFIKNYSYGSPTMHTLKHYDLASGELTVCYQTDNDVYDFCELRKNHWIILEKCDSSIRIIRLAESGFASEQEQLSLPMEGEISLIPVTEELALIELHNHDYSLSCLLPIQWKKSAENAKWYIIRDISSDGIQEISAEQITLSDSYGSKKPVNPSIPGKGIILNIAAIDNTPNVLCRIRYERTIPNSWAGMVEVLYGYVTINVNSMRIEPIMFSATMNDGFSDQKIYNKTILIETAKSTESYRFNDLANTSPFYFVQQPEESLTVNTVYTCSSGTYKCTQMNDSIELTSVLVGGKKVSSVITVLNDGYRIDLSLSSIKQAEQQEFIFPEAITQERFEFFINKMSKSSKKKVLVQYWFITPNDQSKPYYKKEELITRYPSLHTESMYILKDHVAKSVLVKLEEYFAEAGYDIADYRIDKTEVKGNPYEMGYPISYKFIPNPNILLNCTDALELAGLCDQINYSIYQNQLEQFKENEEPIIENQVLIGLLQTRKNNDISLLVKNQYEIDNSLFSISVENVEEKDGDLCITVLASKITARHLTEIEEQIEGLRADIEKQKGKVNSAETQLDRWIAGGKKSEEEINKQRKKVEREKEKLSVLEQELLKIENQGME